MNIRAFKFLLVLCSYCAIGTGTVQADNDSFRTRTHNAAYAATTTEDIQAEIRFGQSVSARVLGKLPLHHDQALTRYVNLVGKALAMNSSRSEIEFRFAVVKSDEINAYSTPGGYIFITTGTLKALQDESELAAVLAHEIAHVSERHIVKALRIRAADSEQSSLSKLLSGSTDTAKVAFFQTVDRAISMLFESGFNQKDEKEADRVGTLLLASTGYDPFALERFLTRIQGKIKEKSIESSATHPPTKERSEEISSLLKSEGLDLTSLPRLPKRFKSYVSFN